MKIRCENCGTRHDLDPPAWVISSGRPFRFRCSACGKSHSVRPGASDDSPAPAPTVASAAAATSSPEPPPDADQLATAVPAERTVTPGPSDRRAVPPTPPPLPTLNPRTSPLGADRRLEADTATPTMAPPALLDEDDDQPEPAPAPPSALSRSEAPATALFLKQQGQIYAVRDWETLRRWIVEQRVDRNDLVSEGGVRWEPVGSRPDLADLFDDPQSTTGSAQVPFEGETPFGAPTAAQAADVWTDDDTDGIVVGLPPLPTEETGSLNTPMPMLGDLLGSRRTGSTARAASPVLLDAEGLSVEDDRPPPTAEAYLDLPTDPGPGLGETPSRRSLYEIDTEVLPTLAGHVVPAPATPDLATPSPMPFASESEGGLPTREEIDGHGDDDEYEAYAAYDSVGPNDRPVPPTGDLRDEVLWEDTDEHPTPGRGVPSASAVGREPAPAPPRPARARREVPTAPPPAPAPWKPPALPIVDDEPMVAKTDDGYPFDNEWERQLEGRSPRRWLWPLALFGTAVAVVAASVWLVWPDAPTPELPEPAPLKVAPTAPPDLVPPAPVPPAPAVDPAPAATAEPAPEPEPEPPPAPVPAAARIEDLLDRGWQLAGTKPSRAGALFREALELDPAHPEANYGYGYAMLMDGKLAEATSHLCRARTAPDPEIRQDVEGLIESRGLVCR